MDNYENSQPLRSGRWLILVLSVLTALSLIFLPILALNVLALERPGAALTAPTVWKTNSVTDKDQILTKIGELYQKMADLEEEKNGLDAQIETAKSDINTTLHAKELLDAQVAATESQIEALDGILAEYDLLIADKQAEINRYQLDYQEKYEVFLERLRQSHEEGTPGILEIFFHSDSFIDILTSIERMNDVLEYDKKLMDELEAETKVLQSEKDKLLAIQVEKKAAEEELVSKKETLNRQISESLQYIQKLEEDWTTLTALRAQVEAGEEVLNREIDKAIEEYNNLAGGNISDNPQMTKAYKDEHVKPSILEAMENGTIQKGGEYYEDGEEYILPLSISTFSNGSLSSRFGYRTYKDKNGNIVHSYHKGIDLAVAYGSPIYAAKSGIVVTVGPNSSYGNLIVVLHDDGTQTRYAHCSSMLVRVGEYVLQGEQIGRVGSTGNATGNCCHFEVRLRESSAWTPYDPLAYLTLPA